ncbi:MAG: alpha/beta hydrolase [Desulfomonilaceae bacterium]
MTTTALRHIVISIGLLCLIFSAGCSDSSDRKLSHSKNGPEAANQDQQASQREARTGAFTKEPQAPKITSNEENQEVIIERISNFLVPTEYFSIKSKHFYDAICAVSLPKDYYDNPTTNYPMVLAFGGAGECAKSPQQGALAWISYYKADEAAHALASNNLKSSDFRELVTPEQLKKFNRSLHRTPYQGVILVCPYSPLLGANPGFENSDYEKYIMEELIPALKKHYRIDVSRIGVDGVSMGGARSMYYGFKYPEVFSRIGSVQAAVGPFMELYSQLIRTNGEKIRRNSIQIVSSDGDIFLKSVENFSSMLNTVKINHNLLILKGPHDYIFNQGPGSIALLAFHASPAQIQAKGPVR